MSISDLLSFVSIAVSIIFGLIITHFCSVRDTRTRVLKDHYIEQIKAIKGRVDTFFHRVAFGKSSSKGIKSWYAHISIDIEGVDKGVRKSLDLQKEEFADVIDGYYAEITGWDDYNNQYSGSKYFPSVANRERLMQMKSEIDDWLNDYIEHINQSNCYPIWRVQKQRIKQSQKFYSKNGCKTPLLCAVWERVEKHIGELLISILTIAAVVFLCCNVEKDEKEHLEKPLNEISYKQDSIWHAIKSFEDKYQPVNVHTKTFNNSSFFNADKVDSVEIKLYSGKPE